jgi:hypothetical protein
MITAPPNIACRYCNKLCATAVEIERAWVHPKKGLVTCCNVCGGYETCPECGKLWENLYQAKNTPCLECADTTTKPEQN